MATSSRDYRYVGVFLYSIRIYLQGFQVQHAIIRLHCATSKSSLWNMEYVARGGALNAHASIVQVYIESALTCICTLDSTLSSSALAMESRTNGY